MKRVLLIEDESHKRDELTSYLKEFLFSEKEIDVVESVREAVISVIENEYDLIVLDMALPTYSISDDSTDGGQDQDLGGVEVLRTLKLHGKSTNVIIVSQFSDIKLDEKRIKLNAAKALLKRKYGQTIRGAVLYKYKSPINRIKISNLLRKMW